MPENIRSASTDTGASGSTTPDYRHLSLWHDTVPTPTPRRSLQESIEVDVAIVGGGLTGLWTAYYLAKRDPGLSVVVLEGKIAGFGASGRNGGWLSALFPASMRKVASISGRDGATALQRKMNETIGEVARAVASESIDCDLRHGGYVSIARNAAQLARARAEVDMWQDWGFGRDHIRLLGPGELQQQVAAPGALGGTYSPHCATVHPFKLVRGLAETVERQGARIFEQTPVTDIQPHRARVGRFTVSAKTVIRATEGYTAQLPGAHRDIVPMYSLMVATEQLPPATISAIGLTDHQAFADKRHLRIYGQRTTDDRIAFGGRGAPYHFGSQVSPSFDRDDRVHRQLRRTLVDLLPQLDGVRFTHAWGGNLAIPRDWCPSVSLDPRTGLGSAGGYVGDGVALANLSARILADLITGQRTQLTTLPIVGHHSPKWELEPVRWLGVNAGTVLFAIADSSERRSGRPSSIAAKFWSALG